MIFYSYPKVNICLKILDILPNNYCSIASRYVRVEGKLYDTLYIKQSNNFKIMGDFACDMEQNTIFKAKEILKIEFPSKSKAIESFSIEVEKHIPLGSGLGGGSSNAASYLIAMNEILELGLDISSLAKLGSKVGADVSFFIYDIPSANVFGIGDIIEGFSEESLELELLLPPISCSTIKVYDEYKKSPIKKDISNLLELDSTTLLKSYDREFLNDLYAPATRLYPDLLEFAKDGYFFSGSGSSFFRLKV